MANMNMEVVSTPPSYMMGERRETPQARARYASPRRAGLGHRAGWGGAKGAGRDTCMNGPLKSSPSLCGGAFSFCSFIFGDLGSESTRYGNLNPKPNQFRSLTQCEAGLVSLYILMGYEVGYTSDKRKLPPHKPGKLLL
jgi:hypothetical protein